MKVRGTEIPNQRAKMATRVPKGIAAEEPSTQRIRFIRKKSANTILGKKRQTSESSGRQRPNGRLPASLLGAEAKCERDSPGAQQGRQQDVGLPLFTSKS